MPDSYEQAKGIFERVRDISYRLPEFVGDEAAQCAYKSQVLIKELSELGFEVRARIAEMDWAQTLFPKDIIDLYPNQITATHMYVEILEDGKWRALDASWDKGLVQAGFSIAEFNGINSPGLPLIRVYDFEEQQRCLEYWSDLKRVADYFEQAGMFLKAANEWLSSVRK